MIEWKQTTQPIAVVDLARSLIKAGARSGEEEPVAEIVEEAMRALGYRDISRDRLGNVVGFVGPEDTPVALLLDGHMDVVAVTGDWHVDPFAGEVRGDRLYGRGATDMKGPLAAAICGVAAAAKGGSLSRAVAVSASVLEETIEGGALAEILDRTQPEMVVICEPSSLSVKTAQRGRIEVVVEARGIPAHAAHPERGKNALLLAAKAINAIEKMQLPEDEVLGKLSWFPPILLANPIR